MAEMNQKLMIENLKELRGELWKHAAESENITPAAWAESLDEAIKTLERIRWRKVGEETPEAGQNDYPVNVLAFTVADNGKYSYISDTSYYPDQPNPWCKVKGVHTTHWAYLPELPELPEEEKEDKNG